MLITVTRDDDEHEVEVDTERYKLDADYKRHIHEQLDIADYQDDIDWDYILELLECADDESAALETRDVSGETPQVM